MNNTKQSIFEAAIKVFSTNGYTGATMDEIASTAGVAKGTLYYYFKSKEEIFKFVISEGMETIKEKVHETSQMETDPILKFREICRIQLDLVYKHKDFFKVIMSQLWGEETRQIELRELIRVYISYIEKHLQEAIDAGVVRNGNTSYMAYAVFGTLVSTAIYQLINEEVSDLEEVVDKLVNYILKGIEK